MQPIIRDAAAHDAPALLTIYNEAVLHTTAVWTSEPRTLDAQALWLEEKRSAGNPVLVAVDQATVVGFATYGPFRAWPGYRYCVENSIYVAASHRGRGIGSLLLAPLIERARNQGLHAIVAGIEAGNAASIKLHEKHGFIAVGRLREVGFKFDRWLDLLFMELLV